MTQETAAGRMLPLPPSQTPYPSPIICHYAPGDGGMGTCCLCACPSARCWRKHAQ